MAIPLRPYQREAVAAVKTCPQQRPLLALACGLGKTIIFSHLIAELAAAGQRCLVLVHVDELVTQTVEKMALVAPGVPVGVVKAERDEHTAPVVVASVQTLARRNRRERLARDFALLVIDEAHRALAPSYRTVMTHFGCFDAGGPRALGVTATPERGDGAGLGAVFQGICYRKDILAGIKEGYLCDLRGLQVHLAADLDSVRTRGGDFIEGELACVMTKAQAPAAMVRAYQEHAPERKALAYLPSVALAADTAGLFREAGIAAAAVSGQTPLGERRQILGDLRAGRLRVVTNCMVLTEGFDEPSAECILLGRPTKSRTLYVQIVGRAARPYPGKDDALIIDLVAASFRHELVSLGDLFGLSPRQLSEGTVLEALAAREQERAERAAAQRLRAQQVDLLRRRTMHWTRKDDLYALPIPEGSLVLVPQDGGYGVVHVPREGTAQRIAQAPSIEYALGTAEDWVRDRDMGWLSQADAEWRTRPASEKQLETLRKMQIPAGPNMTRGEASDALTLVFAVKAARRWQNEQSGG